MCRNRIKLLLLYLCSYLFIHVTVSASSNNSNTESVEEVASNDYYYNLDNNNKTMLNEFLTSCKKPSVSCIRKYLYKYLNDTLESNSDLKLDFVTFSKNNYNYTDSNEINANETEEFEGRSAIGTDLTRKIRKFLVTHNMKFELPDYVLDGAMVEISPRSIEDNGANFNVDITPKQMEHVGEGRILFKKISKLFILRYTTLI